MKYKLIKEYPGSPKLGHVISCNDFTHNGIDRHSCSDYPEFWEEVVEKDYEILSYVQIISNRVYKKDKDGIFISDNMWNLSIPLESHSNIKIHSVKRLSDGEVFTVGDKITGATYNEPRNIISFNISNNKLWIEQDHGSSDLKDIKKLKQPLFTTEDGIDIYENDTVYLTYNFEKPYSTQCSKLNEYLSKLHKNIRVFSTKEKAEEYILLNKPCLSIQDVLNVYTWDKHSFRNSVQLKEKELKELVQQKIK